MSALISFVQEWTENEQISNASDDATDVVYFKVKAKSGADAAEFKNIVEQEISRFSNNVVKLFDGAEHNYLAIGSLLNSDDLALKMMGLGAQLKLWRVITPHSAAGIDNQSDEGKYLATQGYVLITTKNIKP